MASRLLPEEEKGHTLMADAWVEVGVGSKYDRCIERLVLRTDVTGAQAAALLVPDRATVGRGRGRLEAGAVRSELRADNI